MSCKEYQRHIVLSLYEELQEGERAGLEAQLRDCGEGRQAAEAHQTFSSILAEDKSAWEFPSDLLVESRRALADELDQIETKRSWWRVPAFSVVFTPMRMLESATLIAPGLAFGVYISNHQAVPGATPTGFDAAAVLKDIPQDGRVSNVRIVNTDASSATAEFPGDGGQPLRFSG